MSVEFKQVAKQYERDGRLAVADLNLRVERGEFFTLLGPSGCGKTTTLRMVAGLETPTRGEIWIDDEDVTRTSPGDRDVALVFQSYALYPHMSVMENMTLGLRSRGVSKGEARARAIEVAELLGISDLVGTKPPKLSGGQRQRVALGRAIVREPKVFLMDEPLSNLDLKLREHMRTELKRLHQRLRITTIYVTHDQSEAMVLSDRIAVMADGTVQQVGSPLEVYDRPANLFVAEFIGSPGMNFMAGTLIDGEVALSRTRRAGRPVVVGVRPEDTHLCRTEDALFTGKVELVEPVGGVAYVFVTPQGAVEMERSRERLVAATSPHSCPEAGSVVGIDLHGQRAVAFSKDSEQALQYGVALTMAVMEVEPK